MPEEQEKQDVKSITTILRKLTSDDLCEWSGNTILNRGKGYVEKRFDDVVVIYQRLHKTKRWGWETDKTVA